MWHGMMLLHCDELNDARRTIILSTDQCADTTTPSAHTFGFEFAKSVRTPSLPPPPPSPLEADLSDTALIGRVVVRRELGSVPVCLVGAEGVLHGGLRHPPDARQAVHHLLLLPVPLHRNRQLRGAVVCGETAAKMTA